MTRTLTYITLVLLVVITCVMCKASDVSVGKSTWVLLVQTAMAQPDVDPTPNPTPEPDSDICENCNGTGRVGDGTVSTICPVCDGTGKRKKTMNMLSGWPPKTLLEEPKRIKLPYSSAKLIVYVGDNCAPCEALKSQTLPELEKMGWNVQLIYTSTGTVPRTVLIHKGNQWGWTGYQGRNEYLREIKQAIQKVTE